ncbi:MAG: sigma-54 dependent transcriptional regulator [bacterium]
MSKILVADDNKEMCEIIRHFLTSKGYGVDIAADGHLAIDKVRRESFDVLLTDLRMPEMDGMEVLRKVREISPSTMVIVITAFGTIENAVEAMRQGAFDYVLKPFSSEEIDLKIKRALERRNLLEERRMTKESAAKKSGSLIYESPAMKVVLRDIEAAAQLSKPVLIVGSSGTGKSLVAREIHNRSGRADKPFVVINCMALDPFVLDLEIFGSEKESAESSEELRLGKIELAEGGTLFFEEINALGAGTQSKLEAFLAESIFQRVRGTEPLKANVRIIASTATDLSEAVHGGSFRIGLQGRLGVSTIALPPLRERADDIPELAAHFLRRYNDELHKQASLSPEAVGFLKTYGWPGNAHELENAMAHAVLAAVEGTITPAHLPPKIVGTDKGVRGLAREKPGVAGKITAIEKEILLEALKDEGWNLTKAAAKLGMKRTTLQYKAKKYGINKRAR